MNKNDKEFLVEKIRTQYTEKEDTKLDELKALDAKVKRPANVFAYVFGSIGAIVMGSGMSLVIDMVRYRKYQSPVMSVSKIIKLTAALFSMLFLETAMFSQFGGDTTKEIQRIMIMATGGGISVIVVTMAIYMIVRTTKEIRELKKE